MLSSTVTSTYHTCATMSDSFYDDYDPSNAQQRAQFETNKRRDADLHKDKIIYSARYQDDTWEYRHVTLPRELIRYVPKDRLMSEMEWRDLGVQQSLGWFVLPFLSLPTAIEVI